VIGGLGGFVLLQVAPKSTTLDQASVHFELWIFRSSGAAFEARISLYLVHLNLHLLLIVFLLVFGQK